MSEKVSALVDNELDEFERARLLREMGRDEELTERWSRYHLIGLAIRRETVVPMDALPQRVAATLQAGPELATQAGAVAPASGKRPAGRFALAASLVGVLLVGGLLMSEQLTPPGGGGELSSPQQVAGIDSGMRWRGVNADNEEALNALLVEHGEFTSVSGMNGFSAYTKFVAYGGQ